MSAPDAVTAAREAGQTPRLHQSPSIQRGRALAKDAVAGLVASVVLIANIVSFGALMFPGHLSAGTPMAIWAMLIGACIGGTWIALTTTLPPLSAGIDSPTGAVLVVLSAAAGSEVVAAGGSTQAAIQTAMLIFTAATFFSGVVLYVFGRYRLGSFFRFVPDFVVGGFMAATGWFLIDGGVRMTTGRALVFSDLAATGPWTGIAQLASAVCVLGGLLALRRWVKWALALPVALVAMSLASAVALHGLGLSGPRHGWYLPSLGALTPWLPLEAVRASQLTWSMAVQFTPELVAVTVVALISLVTKVSSIEVARKASGDLDREFRSHGIASLAAAPFGGIMSMMQIGSSRLMEHAGGATRLSGVAAALVLGVVAVASLDLPGLIPIPIVAGLVFYLGYIFFADALLRPFSQRAWVNLLLAAGIMAVCIHYGYIVGVIGGVVCACLLFAASYARIGAVRLHLTRAQFASYVSRSAEASRHLAETGDAIQLYRLSGYIFFGSSEGVFERIRNDIGALPPKRVAYVILDFGMVSGADSSATFSLVKLRNFCRQQGATLIYCALSPAMHAALERDGLLGAKDRQHVFVDLNLALVWCEDRLLALAHFDSRTDLASFEPWLQQQLGVSVSAADFIAYLERKDVGATQVLYREGEPSDNLDLLAAGSLVVDVAKGTGETLRVRRITMHTVVGEMGFFRRVARSATVSSEGPAIFFTLTRANFERMRRERPDLASAFDDFLLRVLADRINWSERMVIALGR